MSLALGDKDILTIHQPAALGQNSISSNQAGQEADTVLGQAWGR